MKNEIVLPENIKGVYEEINTLIASRKSAVKKLVNDAMVSLYWGIGECLWTEILSSNKPEYGKRIIAEISDELSSVDGK